MSRDFDECVKRKRIVAQDFTIALIPAELDAARKDLEWAQHSLVERNEKWATIQAYYAIFHAARALLFAKGYREKSHFCLKAAIQTLPECRRPPRGEAVVSCVVRMAGLEPATF